MITVRLPASIRLAAGREVRIDASVRSIAELIDALERQVPGLGAQLHEDIFSFAVNDEILLHRAQERGLQDGDIVEVLPAFSGGGVPQPRRGRLVDAGP